MYTLDDLLMLKETPAKRDEQSNVDRSAYLAGRRNYPTGYPQGLPTGLTERYRGCYSMGWNTSEALTLNKHIGKDW